MRKNFLAGGLLAAAMVLVSSTAASAHVTVSPKTAEPGGYTKLTFKVPNEKSNANTTQLEVNIPTDKPIASVSVEPQPGWTYTVEKSKLATPVETSEDTISEAISKVVWKADANSALKPGEFGEFNLSVGPLPKDTPSIVFKALQTYSDGDVVRWIDVAANGQEAKHPAPTLTLSSSSTSTTAAHNMSASSDEVEKSDVKKSDVDKATSLAIVALVISIAALALVIVGFLTRKKTTA